MNQEEFLKNIEFDYNLYESNFGNLPVVMTNLNFYISFFMIENNNFKLANYFLKNSLKYFNEKNYDINFKALCLYNLGILNYSISKIYDGIHFLEQAHRINNNNNLSIKFLLKIQDMLILAYIDQRCFRKAYCMVQQAIRLRILSYNDDEIFQATKQKFYITFIIDCIEYEFTLLRNNKICKSIDYYREHFWKFRE